MANVGYQGYSYGTNNPNGNTSTTGAYPGGAIADNQIEKAYVEAFKAGFEQAFQQTESKLQPYFEQETQNEEYQYFDRIGAAEEMEESTTRFGDNPNSEIAHDRRRIGLVDYELGKYVDEKDLKRVLTDPMNAYTQALLASGKRKIDDIIIDALYGNAYTGKSGGTTVTFARERTAEGNADIAVGTISKGITNPVTTVGDYTLVAGDTEGFSVGADYGGANSGLTLAKLKAARQTMLRLESINQDDVVNVFLTHTQLMDLLGIDEVINSDYAVRKALAEGQVTTFMGFRFIHTERLQLSTGAAADERRVIVATPKALKFSTGTALKGDVWRVPSKKNIPYIYFKMCAGASRMWGEVAGEIRCKE
jgi:hypothetical protein